MTEITEKTLWEKMEKEKTLQMKKAVELIEQNKYEQKNKKNTIPEALITTEEKQLKQKEPKQRMKKFDTRPKTKFTGTPPCRICDNLNWSPLHKCPALESNCSNCGRNGQYARACRQRQNNNRTVEKLTEEVVNEANESLSKSDGSIDHIEEIKNIEEKYTDYNTTQRKEK